MVKWSVRELVEVGSTQDVIHTLGVEGAQEGTVVVAKRQVEGRGRHGRRWTSPDGGLYLSMLLRPPSSKRIPTLTLVAALAVTRGIERAVGIKARIRWPNDVMVNGRKVAGTIAESSYSGQKLSFVTIGIGLNCNSEVPSEDQWSLATSLAEVLGHQIDVTTVRESILNEFGVLYARWLEGTDPIEEYRNMIETLGMQVVIKTKSGETIKGTADDIESTGELILKLDDRKITLHAEDVERLRETF